MKKKLFYFIFSMLVVLGLGSTAAVATETPSASNSSATSVKTVDYLAALNKGANNINGSDVGDVWQALALKTSPIGLSQYQKSVTKEILIKSASTDLSGTELEKAIIGVALIGDDPTNFQGQNLIKKLTDEMNTTSKVSLFPEIYAIIALSTNDYGEASDKTKAALVSDLLSQQNSKGVWNSTDSTGMVLQALAMNKTLPNVQTAIDKAIDGVKKNCYDPATGDFIDPTSSFSKVANSSSDAMLITGLAACGADVGVGLTSGGVSPIAALVGYQKSTGEFKWQMDQDGAIAMSTEQAVYALDQYDYFKNNKGSIFNFKKASVTPVTPPEDNSNKGGESNPIVIVVPQANSQTTPSSPATTTTVVTRTVVSKTQKNNSKPSAKKNLKLGKKTPVKVIKNQKIKTRIGKLKAGSYIYRNSRLSYAAHYTKNYRGAKYVTRRMMVRTRTGKKAVFYYVHNHYVSGWVRSRYVNFVK
ncbi:hypothetical protein GPK34_11785 [Secundilactobacillus kimchicus]|uniref:Surface layer protein A domain-containing protein n=2 Tax=Secundilactobacillus kimchicus TaxID=528209 RepID=A0A0R1HJF1_9LACO|nr:hypothetical protein [Secundilactobacillus kimchicus]KRK46813.1 hypothetical protein FC96_GL000915 [Secundilactobacillus kimchicus JCM 15530]MBT9672707.1 hypothetical protein [Secundilactobacillus kimchicus]